MTQKSNLLVFIARIETVSRKIETIRGYLRDQENIKDHIANYDTVLRT